jgi:hypothetical protein
VAPVGGLNLDDYEVRDQWSALFVDWSDVRALPSRDDRRHPSVDHMRRISRRRFASPHPDAVSATKRQRRIDRRKFGAAATTVNQVSCILRFSTNPACRARAVSALQASLRAVSSEVRRLLLVLAFRSSWPILALHSRDENDTGPPGTLVVTSPTAPHAPPAVTVVPHNGWSVMAAVG